MDTLCSHHSKAHGSVPYSASLAAAQLLSYPASAQQVGALAADDAHARHRTVICVSLLYLAHIWSSLLPQLEAGTGHGLDG